MTIFDVESDLNADKSLKQIRNGSVRELGKMLFDPEEFKDSHDQLTTTRYCLHEDELFEYAKTASKIRREICLKVNESNEAISVRMSKEEKQNISNSINGLDINPCHPKRKRRTMRQLSS